MKILNYVLFSVDKRFGNIKIQLNLCEILSVSDLLKAITKSCDGNFAIDVANEKNLNLF